MLADDELLPLSGLQHLAFCPRQCALIHVEGLWRDNRLSAEGRVLHEKVHGGHTGVESGSLVVRGLRVFSRTLALYGVCDVVEFLPSASGAELDGYSGRWSPIPVEYKRGRPKRTNADRVQLCAQAVCLEERFSIPVSEGALFYGRTRRREPVVLSKELRRETDAMARSFRRVVRAGILPPARETAGCRRCSLREDCMPGGRRYARRYVEEMMRKASEGA